MAKVRLEDGTYLVAIAMGGVANASNLEQAERIEKDQIQAMKWGISLGVLIPVIAVIWGLIYGCS